MIRAGLVILALVCFSLAGCGGAENAEEAKTEPATPGTEVEQDLKDAGISPEEYGRQQNK